MRRDCLGFGSVSGTELLSVEGSLANKAVTRRLRDAGSCDAVGGDDVRRFYGQESNSFRNDPGSEGSRAGREEGVSQDSGKSRTEDEGIRTTSENGTLKAQGCESAP